MEELNVRKKLFNRSFTLFILGRLVSLIGSGIQMIAIPLYILDVTGSGSAMGIFTFLGIFPRLAAAPFAGVIGDRWNRKKIMVWMDLLRGFLILLLAVMAFRNVLTIIVLFIIQAAISIFDGFFGAATEAMLPDIVEEEQLKRANSVLGSVNSFSMIIGPVLGGIIYGIFGITMVFFLNGLSFVVSAVSEMFIIYRVKFEKARKLDLKAFFIEFKEGLNFIVKHRGLKYLFTFAMILNFLFSPLFQVVEPYVLRHIVKMSAQQYGFIQTFFTVGMLLGNITLAIFLTRIKNKLLMVSGIIVQGIMTMVFGILIFPNVLSIFSIWAFFIITATIYFTIGFFNALVNVPIGTNLQIMTPTEIRSRVFSTLEVFAQLITPLGAVIYGFLLDHIPAYSIFITVSSVGILIMIVFIMIAPNEVYEPETERITS